MAHRGRGLWVLVVLAACDHPQNTIDAGDHIDGPPTDADTRPFERVATFPAAPRPLDIVLVIDDSPSMSDKQVALATAFPGLITKLQAFDGGLPDVRIGVVSTDMGVSATSDTITGPAIGQVGAGGCSGRGKAGTFIVQPNVLRTSVVERYLAHPRGGEPNYNGTLAEALSTQVRLGAGGCGFEQPLAAMATALAPATNPGFSRPDASLAVILLTDEDDCTPTHITFFGPESAALGPLQSFRCFQFGVECSPDTVNQTGPKSACKPRTTSALLDDVVPYRNALLAAKGNDERKVLLAAIVGPPDTVAVELRAPPNGGAGQLAVARACTYMDTTNMIAVADPAVRIAALVDSFPGLHVRESICNANLATAASSIGSELEHLVVGDRCLWRAIGAAEVCEVIDETGSDPAVPIAACGGAATPCYSVVADGACSAGFRLDIARTAPAPANTFTTVRCRR